MVQTEFLKTPEGDSEQDFEQKVKERALPDSPSSDSMVSFTHAEIEMPINLGLPQAENTLLKPRILVVGVGGAGGNAVNNMIQSELEGV